MSLCKESCDAGFDQDCDEQDEAGAWTRSCDLHPTTSCDDDCHYPPPPPMIPWLGTQGTHPSPPPPPPPPEERPLVPAVAVFLIALLFLCCVLCCVTYRTGNGRARDWVGTGAAAASRACGRNRGARRSDKSERSNR